jgi:hypothetical protein
VTDTLEKIKSRGYWHVVIHPADFQEFRIAKIEDLPAAIARTAVQLRGWDFPHVGRQGPSIGRDWIEGRVDWRNHVEAWRLYQSGQFVFYGGIRTDWYEQDSALVSMPNWRSGFLLPVVDTVYRFTEIFELAARLASGPLAAATISVEINVVGLEGRLLWIDSPNRSEFSIDRTASITEFPQTFDLQQDVLLAERKALATRAAEELFARFGWATNQDFLARMQEELFSR